jgi:hypothetical protein
MGGKRINAGHVAEFLQTVVLGLDVATDTGPCQTRSLSVASDS